MTKTTRRKIAAVFALVFGVMTLFVGGKALFGAGAPGAIVPFVLIFNFASGFVYLVVSWGLWTAWPFTRLIALTMFWASLLIGLGLIVHIMTGGEYMSRTVVAIFFRSVIWGGLALSARRTIGKR